MPSLATCIVLQMPMRWTIEDAGDHLLVRAEGDWHAQFILKMIDEIARACEEARLVRVFLDCREVSGHLAENDRYLAGVRIGKRLRHVRTVVVAGKKAYINQRGMNAANRTGAQMLVTSDMEEARRWLFETAC